MADVIYRIKDWNKHYECASTRKVKKFSQYVPVPNRLDGSGYTALVDHPNGAAHYGAWVTLVSIASRCEPRGTLSRSDGRPLDSKTLSRITRLPQSLFDEVLPRLCSAEIEWMECVQWEHDGSTVAQSGSTLPACATTMERSGLEEIDERRGEEIKGEERRREGEEGRPPASTGMDDDSAPNQRPAPTPEQIQEVLNTWNSCPNVNKSVHLTEPRRRQLFQKMKEPFFADNWRGVIAKISTGEFFRGRYRPGFDWLLDEEKFVRTLEGNYDHEVRAGPSKNAQDASGRYDESWVDEITEEGLKGL